MKRLILALALALAGCASQTPQTPEQKAAASEARKARARALLADAGSLLGKTAIGALQSAVQNEISGGKKDFVDAAAEGLFVSVSAGDIRKIISDATGGKTPALEDAAAKVVASQLKAGAGEQEALQAVASVLSATTLTAPAQ